MAMFANSVLFLPTAGGTTDFTVSAAVTGFMTPALAGMPSGTYKYRAESTGLTQWEIGEGVYNSGTGVLTRATVLYNSSGTGTATGQSGAGSKINFSAPPNVGIVQLVEDTLGVDQANSWSPAQKIQAADNIEAYRKGNILGTVSQSGGVPTGAILERGSSANGYYFRLANGLQVCTHFANVNSATGGALGWTFPATFADNPHVAMNMQIGAGSDAKNFNAQMTYQGISGSGATLTYTTASTVTGHLIAIGRWF